VKVRKIRCIVSVAVIIAVGVNADGQRENPFEMPLPMIE
jgi:transposase-like protein